MKLWTGNLSASIKKNNLKEIFRHFFIAAKCHKAVLQNVTVTKNYD